MKSKNELQKIMNRTKKFSKKLNKTIKNKSALKKCENFCKKDYLIKMNNILKNSAKKYGNPYKSPTKEDNEFAYNTCKKSFCNAFFDFIYILYIIIRIICYCHSTITLIFFFIINRFIYSNLDCVF